jgi:hypothetical protein
LAYADGLATQPGGVSQYAKDLAFKVQSELEGAVLHLAKEMKRVTGAANLCFAGGVALNSVANGLIARQAGFERIFIPPAAHDGGQAMGLAYHGCLMLTSGTGYLQHSNGGSSRKQSNGQSALSVKPMKHAYCGRSYPESEIQDLLLASGLPFTELPNEDELVESAAENLARRKIVGWFNGGSEVGPRALGHRSILANPDREEMKDQLNNRVKFRESFRPFAPSVLREKASEVFELDQESPYMLLVVPVRETWKPCVPAITHVDGTARVQTVDREIEPLYHKLISAFERRTAIPLVLNTSFNLRGMPIVESPIDALQCFLYTDMDSLYLGRYHVEQPLPSYLMPSKAPGWELAACRDIESNASKLICRSHDLAKQLTMEAGQALITLIELLDGKTSLQSAYEKAYRNDAALNCKQTMKASVCAIQHLVREGVMQLKTGQMTFAAPALGRHWWQQSASKNFAQIWSVGSELRPNQH